MKRLLWVFTLYYKTVRSVYDIGTERRLRVKSVD